MTFTLANLMHIRPWEHDLMTVAQIDQAMDLCDAALAARTPDGG